MKVLGGIVLLLSFAGYANYLINVKRITVYLVPAIVMTSITGIMFLAGLINIMPLAVYSVLGFGTIILFRYRKDVSYDFIFQNKIGFAVCLLLLGYVFYYTYGGVYEDGDTMTHWGIIVRVMYQNNRLPNFADSTIAYQSYPPATACWIYFILKIFGYGEGKALFAQGIWMLSCVMAMFALNKSQRFEWDILIAAAALAMLHGIGLGGLRVDAVLSVVTVAMCVAISEFRNDLSLLFWICGPFCLTLTLIKNSGILFVFFMIIAVFIWGLISKAYAQSVKGALALSSIAIGGWYLWERHIKMVYSWALGTRHSMNIGYMKSVFGEKTKEQISTILNGFISKWFSLNKSYEWELIVVFFAVSLCIALIHKKRRVLFVPALVGIYYLVYKFCLLSMYLFNMPGDDALSIAGYVRYQKTFSLIVLGMILWMALEYIPNPQSISSKSRPKQTAILVATAFLAWMGLEYANIELMRPDYSNGGSHRRLVTMVKETRNGLTYSDKVITYHTYQFTSLFTKFTFDNSQCTNTSNIDKINEVLEVNSEGYDYLIILEENKSIKSLLRDYGYSDEDNCIRLK